jgi:hypothetical protein
MGEQVLAKFQVKNKSTKTIKPKIISSCGCRDVTIKPAEIPPDKVADITVKIDTYNRPGKFLGYVELHVNGKADTVFWISGHVLVSARVVCEPGSIDLGIIKKGEKRKVKLTAQVLTKSEKINWIASVGKPDKKYPIIWNQFRLKHTGCTELRHFHFVDTFAGHIEFRGLSTGSFKDVPLPVKLVEKNGKRKAYGFVMVKGRVVGNIWTLPEEIFLGIVSVGERQQFKIYLHTPDAQKPPTVKLPDKYITLKHKVWLSSRSSWEFDFIFKSKKRIEVYMGTIVFQVGTQKAHVKVLGGVR